MRETGRPGADAADEVELTAIVLARALRVKEAELQPTLDAVVSTAAEVTGHDAGLVLVRRGVLVPQATTGRAPHRLDQMQQQLGTGPCVLAAQEQTVVRVEDTKADDRWPEFCAEAHRMSVSSMLCVPLWIDDRLLGTLSLYAGHPAAFTDRDEGTAALSATLAAAALADAQRAEQLRTALRNRDVIGQAKGILMERHRVTAAAAFDLLSRASQARNEKLVAVAELLIETGELVGERSGGR